MIRQIQKLSPLTGKLNAMNVDATPEQWAAYDSGVLIQNALPHLDKEVREFMISGSTPEDWAKLFPPVDTYQVINGLMNGEEGYPATPAGGGDDPPQQDGWYWIEDGMDDGTGPFPTKEAALEDWKAKGASL